MSSTNDDPKVRELRLRALKLEEQKREVISDIRDLYLEAKGSGIDDINIAGIQRAVKLTFRDIEKRERDEEIGRLAEHHRGQLELQLQRA